MNCVTFQDRRQGETSKPVLVRQEPVRDAEKNSEAAANRGQRLFFLIPSGWPLDRSPDSKVNWI